LSADYFISGILLPQKGHILCPETYIETRESTAVIENVKIGGKPFIYDLFSILLRVVNRNILLLFQFAIKITENRIFFFF